MTVDALALPPFAERFPWLGGDLQTIRSRLLPAHRLPAGSSTSIIELPTSDGSGDRLVAAIDRPAAPSGATVLLIHGLAGAAGSRYMRASGGQLVRRGHPVVRLNLRGAGASAATCRQRYHAGRTGDLRDAIAGLPAELIDRGICAMGFSLGANALLKMLGEDGTDTPVRAAISVSAPIDLSAACDRIDRPRNRPYRAYLLTGLKADAKTTATSAEERAGIDAIRTIRDFDDVVTGPKNGFRDAADYYAHCSAQRFLGGIAIPTLLVHAGNDPWVPDTDYRRLAVEPHTTLRVALLAGGGHVGFHGTGSGIAWHDRVASDLFGQDHASRDPDRASPRNRNPSR